MLSLPEAWLYKECLKSVCEYCLCLFMSEYWTSYHRMQDEFTCVYPAVFCTTGVE